MNTVLIIIAILCVLVGIAGSFLPILPGPTLSYIGLLLMRFTEGTNVTNRMLVITGILLLIVSVLDYIAPTWFTDKSGGSKAATRGTLIGTILGLFFAPWGLIVGPFVGAFVGELLSGRTTGKALRVALMSFVAFLLTTGIKVIYCVVLLFMVFKDIF